MPDFICVSKLCLSLRAPSAWTASRSHSLSSRLDLMRGELRASMSTLPTGRRDGSMGDWMDRSHVRKLIKGPSDPTGCLNGEQRWMWHLATQLAQSRPPSPTPRGHPPNCSLHFSSFGGRDRPNGAGNHQAGGHWVAQVWPDLARSLVAPRAVQEGEGRVLSVLATWTNQKLRFQIEGGGLHGMEHVRLAGKIERHKRMQR